MKKLNFKSKAQTLDDLKYHLSSGVIKPLKIFSVKDWRNDPVCVLESISKEFTKTVIIRSSSHAEDSEFESAAGKFTSIANINPQNSLVVSASIESVIASYPSFENDSIFFVQEQVTDITMSGVVFTRDKDTLGPYVVVNYDKNTSSHDSVTSGTGTELRTWIRFRNAPFPVKDFYFEKLIQAITELESIFSNDALDIEFAFDAQQILYILQVRPIVVQGKKIPITEEDALKQLSLISERYEKIDCEHPCLCGRKTILSVMTDWNPAEMIGIKPRPLALSLYKDLITDSTWAYQRHNYGYRNLRSVPLLQSVLGTPYIDVRASFNSFIPDSLDEDLAYKLVDYYSEMLGRTPKDHDKVEFNIVFSCYYLNLPEKIKKLRSFGFSELELDRIKFALLTLTNNIIKPSTGLYRKDYQKVNILPKRVDAILKSNLPLLDKIYWLIEDCKRYGTLPFAGLARAGFIAVQFLRSFEELGIISKADLHGFMSSLNTVGRSQAKDLHQHKEGKISKEMFLEKYGHLRPGTYDILSKRYDEAFEDYFSTNPETGADHEAPHFAFTPEQQKLIQRQLIDNGILVSFEELIQFIREAIEGRELGKFIFTKSVSEILKCVEALGDTYGFSQDDMSFFNISDIQSLQSYLITKPITEILSSNIKENKESYSSYSWIMLPQIIMNSKDVFEFYLGDVEPNFVTSGRITSTTVIENAILQTDLKNKIIFIRSADPGYDWLFSRQIGGLITMYGGVNSHMAIRCAELNIPAVIGCGEDNYTRWSASKVLSVDCGVKQVKVV